MSPYGTAVYSEISDRWVNPMVKVWEDFMETPVPDNCCIHHINQDKLDNRIENLVCMTKSEHMRIHHRGAKSQDVKRKISETLKGKKPSEETKQKIRETMMGVNKNRKRPDVTNKNKKYWEIYHRNMIKKLFE